MASVVSDLQIKKCLAKTVSLLNNTSQLEMCTRLNFTARPGPFISCIARRYITDVMLKTGMHTSEGGNWAQPAVTMKL